MSFDVDAVYTWANSADPEWQARRKATHEALAADGYPPSGNTLHRYRDNGELRHSLRSIERHAPFFRHIHIVHGGAPPPWLRTDDPRISLIRDDDLFPDPSLAPSYSSDAIEAFVHRIPGLAEHYVYFNDDFFVFAPVRVEDFFDADGTAIVQITAHPLPDPKNMSGANKLYYGSVWNTGRILSRHMGAFYRPIFQMRTPRRLWAGKGLPPEAMWSLPAHVAQPFRKSVWPVFHDVCADEVRTLTRYRFRHPDIFVSNMVAAYLSLREGLARFVYPPADVLAYPAAVDAQLAAWRELLLGPEERRPKLFCLNDGAGGRGGWPAYVSEILTRSFPTPSRWERG